MLSYKLCFKKNPTIESLALTDLFKIIDFGKADTDLDKVVPLGITKSLIIGIFFINY